MQISLLNWPPKRLIKEAVLVHNLRHPNGEQLDPDSSSWDKIVPCLFAFIRHELTDYDSELYSQTGGERNQAARDRLRGEVIAKAKRTWKWLKADPRPFPPSPQYELELDEIAYRLANLRTLAHHLEKVLSSGAHLPRGWPEELERMLDDTRTKIANYSTPFNPLKTEEGYSEGYSRPTRDGQAYDFFGVDYPSSYLTYVPGVHCPRCHQKIQHTKSAVKMGQGRRRYLYACHCICIAVDSRRIRICTETWGQSLAHHHLMEPSVLERETP